MFKSRTGLKDNFWFAPLIAFVGALALFSINLERPPHPDELHHVLAGQHLFETGHPAIADGEYTRGILYTWLVASSYAIFGDSLSSARLPAVLLVALIAPIVLVWVRREAGSLAAWIATTLFVTSPFVVEIAQFSRFYCLQMMFFTLGSICIFYGATLNGAPSRRAGLLGLAVTMLALSVWVQDTTFIGLVGIGAWVVGTGVTKLLRGVTSREVAWRVLIVVLVLAILLFLVERLLSDQLEWAWRRYRTASLFATEHVDEFWFYHFRYLLFYPTFWPLVGVLAICAAVRNSRLAWFAITVFGVSFLMTSFAAQKATRYFSYAQPLLAVIWGIGLGYALPALWRFTMDARSRFSESLALPPEASAFAGRAMVGMAIVIVILMNPFWLRTAAIIGNVAMPMEAPTTDWRAARDVLAPWTSSAEIMITTEELGALYFLGRSDVRFSPSKFDELPRDRRFEFGIDPRIGRPIITTPESLEMLIACFDSGFMTGPIEHWGKPTEVSEIVESVLRRHATPIEVPGESHLYAWGWRRQGGGYRPAYCAGLEQFSGQRRQAR